MKLHARRSVLLALAATALVAISGCESLGQKVETPKLSLVSINLLSAGLLEQRYGVMLRVENPNPISLPIEGVSYELKLAGDTFATGVTPDPFSVPKYGETEFQIEVRTNLLKSAKYLVDWYRGGNDALDYELGGRLQVDLPFVGAVPFSESGSISLTR